MAGIIVDIDGTIVFGDKPIKYTIDWVNNKSMSHTIYIVTARYESRRQETFSLLRDLGIKYDKLFMNSLGHSHQDGLLSKKENGLRILHDNSLVLAVENDADARAVYASIGISSVDPSYLPKSLIDINNVWKDIF